MSGHYLSPFVGANRIARPPVLPTNTPGGHADGNLFVNTVAAVPGYAIAAISPPSPPVGDARGHVTHPKIQLIS